MQKIILDVQSGLYAKAIQRILVQELDEYQVIISEHPEKTADLCKIFQPYALLMEVIGYTPWMLEERLATLEMVKQQCPNCKTVILVDDIADKKLADAVKTAKQNGKIDAFLFSSITDSYLVAIMDSL